MWMWERVDMPVGGGGMCICFCVCKCVEEERGCVYGVDGEVGE